MTLSDELRELLDKQNGSQETLADMMKKMHRSAISRYECENLRK